MLADPDDSLINDGVDFDEGPREIFDEQVEFSTANNDCNNNKKRVTKFNWKRERN